MKSSRLFIITREEQKIVENLIVMATCEEWKNEPLFTGMRFRSDLTLVDCTTENMMDELKTIVPKLTSWKRNKLSACVGGDIPGTHMVRR